jgi:hypothetical protein
VVALESLCGIVMDEQYGPTFVVTGIALPTVRSAD